MATLLRCRATTLNGVTNYKDLLVAAGASTTTTAIVNTTASGNNIPWTDTAGGNAIAWVSPPLTSAVNINGTISFTAAGIESNMSANTGVGVGIYRRTQEGTETLLSDSSDNAELNSTSRGDVTWSASGYSALDFAVGDQIVVKWEADAQGTMGGPYTATLYYDGTAAGGYECTVNFTETFSVASTYGPYDEVPACSVVVTGSVPTISVISNPVISVGTGTVGLTGQAPTIRQNIIRYVGQQQFEFGRTNFVPNSMMEGATSSTLPTGWAKQATSGLTVDVVGIGTDEDPYIDVRCYGTPSSGTGYTQINVALGNESPPAAIGQKWAYSVDLKLVAGSDPNDGGSTYPYLSPRYLDAAGGSIYSEGVPIHPTSSWVNYSTIKTIPSPPANYAGYIARTNLFINIQVAFGYALDVTYRVRRPQLEHSGVVRAFIPTYGLPVNVGEIPTLQTTTSISPTVGSVSVQGQQPSLGVSYTFAVPSGAISTSGQTPVALRNHIVFVAQDSLEIGRRNWFPNTTMQGADVGVWPTGWGAFNGGGINWTIVGVGTDEDPYIDVRLSGTNGGGQVWVSLLPVADGLASIPGGVGQSWCGAFDVKLIAGTNPTGGVGNPYLSIRSNNLAGNYITSWGNPFYPTTEWVRYSVTNTLRSADTANIERTNFYFSVTIQASQTVDVTWRIRRPQYERGNAPTAWISTSSNIGWAGEIPTLSVVQTVYSPATCALTLTGSVPTIDIGSALSPVVLSDSTFISAGGAGATTRQLNTPAEKTTGDFQAGEITDDTNPVPGLDLGSNKWTEIEWAIKLTDIAVTSDQYEFRVTDNGTPIGYTLLATGTVGAVDTSIVVGTGSLSLTGLAPNKVVDSVFAPATVAVNCTGLAPTLFVEFKDKQPAAGALVLAGQAPTLIQSVNVFPATGALSLAGQNASVLQNTIFLPTVGSLVLLGQVPSTTQAAYVYPTTGSVTLAGAPPTLTQSVLIAVGTGSLSLVGQAPSQAFDIGSVTGSVQVSGQQPVASLGFVCQPATGSLTIIGQSVSITQAVIFPVASGTMLFSGQVPVLVGTGAATVPAGAINFTGIAPTVYIEGVNQVSFRWRNDDGDETTATWKGAQDADGNVVKNVVVRLQVVLDGKGDPAGQQYQLEYRKVGTSDWAKVA